MLTIKGHPLSIDSFSNNCSNENFSAIDRAIIYGESSQLWNQI